MSELGNGSSGNLSLPAIADLLQAAPLKQELERALASGGGVVVDASAVQRISSPYLQVLLAGQNAFAKAGGPSLSITNPSAAFLETVSVLGLAGALRLA